MLEFKNYYKLEPQHVPPIICKLVEFKTVEIHIPDAPLFSNPLENRALLLKFFIQAYYVIGRDKGLFKRNILQPIWEKHKHIYLFAYIVGLYYTWFDVFARALQVISEYPEIKIRSAVLF